MQRVIMVLAGVLLAYTAVPALAQECDPVEVAELHASDAHADDQFGWSVSIDGDTAIVGAIRHRTNNNSIGSAYIFTRIAGVWTEQGEILPDDGERGDYFGISVSISGDTAIVGAPGDSGNGSDSGSAYVFTRTDGVWLQQAELLADDGAQDDRFGSSVCLSGDTAIVGAANNNDNGQVSGSAYIFTRSGGVWTQQVKLLPADNEAGDWFGDSASIDGDTVAVGAWGDGRCEGSVYVYTRSEGLWTQQAKLQPADGAPQTYFGVSVSLSESSVVIGAHRADANAEESGAAYVFVRNGDTWSERSKLLPADGFAHGRFGFTVSLDGNTAIVGRPISSDHDTGAAYVFTRTGADWIPQAKLQSSDGAMGDVFGYSVSISGDTAIMGVPGDDDIGDHSGSAYIFNLGCKECPGDFNGDGIVDRQDFLDFLSAWWAGNPLADWNNDGTVNTQDFIAYLGDWAAGCD